MLFLCVLAGFIIIQVSQCGGFVWQSSLQRVVARPPHIGRFVRQPAKVPIGVPKRIHICRDSRNDDLLGNREVENDKGHSYPVSSSHEESFIQQQFESFNLGVSWSQFGNAPLTMIHQLLDSRKDLNPQQKIIVLDMWADHPNRHNGVSSVRCKFSRVRPSLALNDYITTGNRLKDSSSNSGMTSIERGIDSFIAAVKHCGELGNPAVFAYLFGSSGLGKTQLAFALNRRVLYIPFGNAQAIGNSFERLWEMLEKAINLDLAALREEEIHFQGNGEGVDIFTATHIESAMTPGGQDLAFHTVSVLLKLLESFASPTYDPYVEPRAGLETNVFLGVDLGEVTLQAMTLKEGRAAIF